MLKQVIAIFIFTASVNASAHCPATFKPEQVCLMLDQNVLYIYDHKAEHNGPYKDLKSSLLSIKVDGKVVTFSRAARGVFKIESKSKLKAIDLEILNGKEKVNLKVSEK